MKKIIILAFVTLALFSTTVIAEVSHVSINQRLFELGGYPKLKVNIVSSHKNPNKVQFFLRQSVGEERLVAKSLNSFSLLVSGVEDVVDSEAVLVVKEHRINRWREVSVLSIFDGDSANRQTVEEVASTQQPVNTQQPTKSSKEIASTRTASTAMITVNVKDNCNIDFNGSETLWRIGLRQSKVWGVSTYGAMLAIFDANPRAFRKNSINGLRADAKLQCPSRATLNKYSDAVSAEELYDSMDQPL